MGIGKARTILRQEGYKGLVERLKRRISRRLEKKSSASTVTHQAAMAWFGNRKEGYERLIAAVQPYVRSDTVVFDVGANIGYFTLLLTERVSFRGSAYLFEPVPTLAELCKMTFSQAPFKVNVFDFGLGDKDTQEDIFVAGNGNLGWNTLIAQKATADMTRVSIRLKVFDHCGIEARPGFIKIDVEGAEFKVLRGMLGSFRKWQPLPVVLCEIGWGQSHPAWAEEMSVFTEMKRLGYTMCNLEGLPIEANNLQETTDVLFLPGES